RGAELVLETAPLSGLRFTAGYTYLNAEITKSNTPSDPLFGDKKQLLRRPRHSGSVWGSLGLEAAECSNNRNVCRTSCGQRFSRTDAAPD
ncbi:MAG TPA: hypothetical protein VGV15_06295, partial [Terriglobales bacterium]|nr:hypothetical protein [Terriglobales bacterium]